MSSTVAASKPTAGRKTVAPKATPAVTATPAPAVVTAKAVAPVVAKTVAPATVPVATPAVATTTATATATAPANTVEAHVEENVNIVAQFTAAVEKVNALRTELASIFSTMKKLEKQIPRELKKAQKGRRARKVEGVEGAPKKETIFTKPTPISDALCSFLGVAKGSSVSRSEVTSRVCRYAKEKGLMEKQNINADAAMRKLLALKEGDDLKILNLQRFLKPHYLPTVKPVPTTA
jgi:chromatin remodeling complex protein RSC6